MRRCLACIEEGMRFNRASKEFGIPKPTIRRHRLGLNKYAKGDVNYEEVHVPCQRKWRMS